MDVWVYVQWLSCTHTHTHTHTHERFLQVPKSQRCVARALMNSELSETPLKLSRASMWPITMRYVIPSGFAWGLTMDYFLLL